MCSRQHHSDSIQPFECDILRLPEVGTVQLAIALAIGSPILPTALVAGLFFARSEGLGSTAERERGGGLQPGMPVWSIDCELRGLTVLRVGEHAIFYDGRCARHGSCSFVICRTEHGFPNSIAHVREPHPEGDDSSMKRYLLLQFFCTALYCNELAPL